MHQNMLVDFGILRTGKKKCEYDTRGNFRWYGRPDKY